MASTTAKAKSFVKRVIGRPEEPIPVVTVKDFVGGLSRDPKRDVRLVLFAIRALYLLLIRRRLCDMWSLCSQYWAGSLDTVSLLSLLCALRALTAYVDLGWLTGDVIAGLTVGIVVVPQSMSYAQVCPYLSR